MLKKYVIPFVVLFLVIGMVREHPEQFIQTLKQIRPHYLIVLCITHVFLIGTLGLALKCVLNRAHIAIQPKEWLGLAYISNFLNHLFPYQGNTFRYLYLKNHYQMTLKHYGEMYSFYTILHLLSILMILFIGLYFSTLFNLEALLHLAQMATVLLCVGIMVIGWIIKKNHGPTHFKNAIDHFGQHRHTVLTTFFSLCLSRAFACFAMYDAFLTLGVHMPIAALLVIVASMLVSVLLLLTPGNIGVSETLIGSITYFLQHDFELGFTAMLVFRTTQILTLLPLSMIFSLILFHRFQIPIEGNKK